MPFYRMLAATHIAIGAGISTLTGNPVIGFAVGFGCHFLSDIIPHGDSYLSDQLRKENKKKSAVTFGTLDYLVAIPLFFVFLRTVPASTPVYVASAVGSIAPDLLVGLHDLTKSKYLRWFNTLHFWFHDMILNKTGDVKLRYALAAQALVITGIVILL